jgi:hypothetical protein
VGGEDEGGGGKRRRRRRRSSSASMLNVDIALMQDRAERRRALGRGFEPLLRGIGTAWVGVQLESSHLLCLDLRFGVRPPRLRACVGRSCRVAGGASTFLSAPNSFVGGISVITYRVRCDSARRYLLETPSTNRVPIKCFPPPHPHRRPDAFVFQRREGGEMGCASGRPCLRRCLYFSLRFSSPSLVH